MRPSLERWISDADAVRHLEHFHVSQTSIDLAHVHSRADEYYLSLVGELFDGMRTGYADANQWARLGNALALFAAEGREENLRKIGVSVDEATLFAAAAFYFGGFPASAHLMMRGRAPAGADEPYLACFDLLARPTRFRSTTGVALAQALRRGDMDSIESMATTFAHAAVQALSQGANEWVPAHLLQLLVARFRNTNIRTVLPEGNSEFWTPLVSSLLSRTPPCWEYFPSQIETIQRGLLTRMETFSFQMPTGAGKTALCETLLYWHLKRSTEDVAVLLVPYRSLASELRATLVKRLNSMGLSARCAYGGTVPTGDEIHGLEETRALVATPESLSGLLGADPQFFRRISLVVCDEGHLLDSWGRGVCLELLLSRMMAREGGAPRFVFTSAIVPNIEEINAWLGGTSDSVVRSNYRPALAEYAVLKVSGTGASSVIALDMHPHEAPPMRFTIEAFLHRQDFAWTNPATGRPNTFAFQSIKTLAIAAARKSLSMGAVAVFAANKRGDQGAIGLAEELLKQLLHPLSLPEPLVLANTTALGAAVQYLEIEYGGAWVGTRALAAGAVLHHGDIPQETREVIEALIRRGHAKLAICTNTLAEGVNLPIRTLVLYSVRRRRREGRAEDLLTRDIKNLVGRAGRAGATMKGLVICANEEQWPLVEGVARQPRGEPVSGALRRLLKNLGIILARQNITLTNTNLEESPGLFTLIDGIDSTLIDLAAEEVGEEVLVQLAIQLADQTFAARQADDDSKRLLKQVFELRARRVIAIRSAGRLGWVRETGARARMLESVETGLLPMRQTWDDVSSPVDPALVNVILEWAWTQPDLQDAIRDSYHLHGDADTNSVRQSFFDLVTAWLAGSRFVEMATRSNLSIDDTLGVHAHALTFGLQILIEQGIALLAKLLESQDRVLASAIAHFPEHLRFGVPTGAARVLASGGMRHRSAAVEIGKASELLAADPEERLHIFVIARQLLVRDPVEWRARLGGLVYENALRDVTPVAQGEEENAT